MKNLSKPIESHQHHLVNYIISKDKSLLDLHFIYNFLSKSSNWEQGRSYEVVKRSIEHSICFGVYLDTHQKQKLSQVGFGRVVTDNATFAWLCDVFIIDSHRGRVLEAIYCCIPFRVKPFMIASL
jgi:hypothetical protein